MKHLLDLIYSIYFNFRYLPFHMAIHLPIEVSTNLRMCKLRRGQISIVSPCKFGQIKIGIGKSPGLQSFKAGILIASGGEIRFCGKAVISQGTVLRCDKKAQIEFGNNFYCNANCYMRSTNKISFGDNCALGWGITLNTSDGHVIWHNGKIKEMEGPIYIGNNVWLTSNCTLCKNTQIPDHCIVTQGAIVTKRFYKTNCLIGGIPAKEITENIEWKA